MTPEERAKLIDKTLDALWDDCVEWSQEEDADGNDASWQYLDRDKAAKVLEAFAEKLTAVPTVAALKLPTYRCRYCAKVFDRPSIRTEHEIAHQSCP